MKRLICAATVAISIVTTGPVLAWDPDRDDSVSDGPPAAWMPEPAPVAPPPGIYLVTDPYAGDSVTRVGDVTTYSTETVHEITGSYARVLESVGTGGSSPYDGAAFNGRASMTDGRAVAGTYYENYVLTDSGFVAVSVVFFQDDSEIARALQAARPAPATPSAPPTGPSFSPSFGPSLAPVVPLISSAAGAVTPSVDHGAPPPATTVPAPARPAVLLPDRSIEILRGRRTELAFNGADVVAWRLVSGDCVPLGPLAGGATQPFVGRWDRLPPPNGIWITRFLLDYTDGTSDELVVRVAVRAPALVEE
jgi:hypothetical protein